VFWFNQAVNRGARNPRARCATRYAISQAEADEHGAQRAGSDCEAKVDQRQRDAATDPEE
jgi:hypothetical protein